MLQLFAVYENQSAISGVLIIPEVVRELFVGIYLTFKGFAPSHILTAHSTAPSTSFDRLTVANVADYGRRGLAL